MKTYFADTFYFLALMNSRDPHHSDVTNFNTSQQAHLVTTLWVLTEVADAMAAPQNRLLFLRLLDRLQDNPMVTLVPFSEKTFAAGLQLYRERGDKDWPLTDCISFAVMLREGITEALTGDRHFEQAGFVPILKK